MGRGGFGSTRGNLLRNSMAVWGCSEYRLGAALQSRRHMQTTRITWAGKGGWQGMSEDLEYNTDVINCQPKAVFFVQLRVVKIEKLKKKEFGFLTFLTMATLGLHSCISTFDWTPEGVAVYFNGQVGFPVHQNPYHALFYYLSIVSLPLWAVGFAAKFWKRCSQKINLIKPIINLLFLPIIH